MRRFVWLVPVVAAVACTGLYLENGNAYPCDFSEGPGLRDAVCQPGDVCGLDNVCRKYLYEGPRFEAGLGLTVPAYGPDAGEGQVLHPLVLKEPIEFITHEVVPEGSAFVVTQGSSGEAGLFELGPRGQLSEIVLPPVPGPNQPRLRDLGVAPFTDARGNTRVLVTPIAGKPLFVADLGAATASLVPGTMTTPMMGDFRSVVVPELAFSDAGVPRVLATAVVWNLVKTSVVREQAGAWGLVEIPDAGGGFGDVVGLPTANALWLLMRKNNELELRMVDGTQSTALSLDPPPGLTAPRASGKMRTDVGGRVVVVDRNGVLSTFQVLASSTGLTLTRAWPDCRPCGAGRPGLLSPTTASGTVRVELSCTSFAPDDRELGVKTVVVTGSIARSQLDSCTTESLEFLGPVRRNRSTGWDSQAGLVLGGRGGEVWSGDSLSTLRPAYLDRVPFDVAPAVAGGALVTAALTEDYLALQLPPSQPGLNNGFRRIGPREVGLDEDGRLGGFVHGVQNWGVSTTGTLISLETDAGLEPDRFGPTLVRSSGEPIGQTIGGEGFVLPDGGHLFFLAADDSLYQVSNPEELLTSQPSDDVVTPDLTPEPSVPIRSLALERTPLGTGEDYARGYLVTSRNVFAWELSGTPLRWSSTPIEVSAGEPLEVWFDSSRSALGRVGFGDGQIYTLPGGYQLAEPLPADEDGVPAQVLDYENLGGWPVAYTTTGVFVAGWDLVNGKLQNRFPDGGINRPMTWRELTLAGGATPWMRKTLDGGVPRFAETKPGKLFVAVDPPITLADGVHKEQTYRLLLFLDDQVLQVARHVRNTQ